MSEEVSATIRRLVRDTVRRDRLPSLLVALGHAGKPIAVEAAGLADVEAGRAARRDSAYRIGSITKTFTAAVILLLAERGELDLDEPIERYLPGTAIGRARLRQLLAHCGGVQREAPLDMWETMQGPSGPELVESLRHAEQLDRPGRRWHYSNLGYAVLGQIVERVTGEPCQQQIDRELLAPLGLTSTTWQAPPTPVRGYRFDPYQECVHREPDMQQESIGVAGQLWSTAEDLLKWGDVLLGGATDVLPVAVVDAMHTLHVVVDRHRWTSGWGLGLILDRTEDRILAGHTGAMPGFLAAMSMDRSARTVAVALSNITRGVRIGELAARALTHASQVADHQQDPPEKTQSLPAELDGALGRWWSEADETIFTWRSDGLHACLASDPANTNSRFIRLGEDQYRAVEGRLQGERLHLIRDSDGQITSLNWATYPHTREPR